MDEKGRVGADVANAVEFEIRARPDVPILFGHAGRGRAKAKKIDHHQLAVAIPATVNEATLGSPAHDHGFVTVEQPAPIDALEELRSQAGAFRLIERGLAGDDATGADGCLDGRDSGRDAA